MKVFLRRIFVGYKEINHHQVKSYSKGILLSVHVGGKSAIRNNLAQVQFHLGDHIDHFRHFCYLFVCMFLDLLVSLWFKINILLNFAPSNEVRKALLALKQKNIKFDHHYERGPFPITATLCSSLFSIDQMCFFSFQGY